MGFLSPERQPPTLRSRGSEGSLGCRHLDELQGLRRWETAPFGGFRVPTVNYTLPQLFPLMRQEVPSRHEGGRRTTKRQNVRRSQAQLVNSVIDGLNWYSERGP